MSDPTSIGSPECARHWAMDQALALLNRHKHLGATNWKRIPNGLACAVPQDANGATAARFREEFEVLAIARAYAQLERPGNRVYPCGEAGWETSGRYHCTREAGHEGPCAAVPVDDPANDEAAVHAFDSSGRRACEGLQSAGPTQPLSVPTNREVTCGVCRSLLEVESAGKTIGLVMDAARRHGFR